MTNVKNMLKTDLINLVTELVEERDGLRDEQEKVYNVNATLLRQNEEFKKQIEKLNRETKMLADALRDHGVDLYPDDPNSVPVCKCNKREEVEIRSFGNLLKFHGLKIELKYFGQLYTSGRIQVNNSHPKYFIVQGGKSYEKDLILLKKALEDKGEKVYLQTDINGVRLNIVK